MTVEAFINFYGVYRLGEEQFKRHVERLPIERKMQLLLLICDGLEVDKGDRLIIALKAVAERRNAARTSEGKAGPTRPACERPHWMAHSRDGSGADSGDEGVLFGVRPARSPESLSTPGRGHVDWGSVVNSSSCSPTDRTFSGMSSQT